MGVPSMQLLAAQAAAGGAPVTITESFNTANSDTLGPDLTWTETQGDLDIVSNQVKSATWLAEARAESDLTDANHYAQAACYKNAAASVNDYVRVLARFDSSARTHYGLGIICNNTYVIFKRVTGTFTSLSTGSVTWANGDVMRLEVNGSTISAHQNGGAAFASISNSDITTGTRTGIAINQTTASADNFEAGDL